MRRILEVFLLSLMMLIILSICNNNTTENENKINNSKEEVNKIIEYVPEIDIYEHKLQEMQSKMLEIESITDEKEWFIIYKNIITQYYEWIDPSETIYDYFTEDEVRLICQTVETECYQQSFKSKCNVASVVLNRYYSGKFGENITEIITNENQFAYKRNNITEDTILAVMYSFEIQDTTNGALFFHSNNKTDTFCGANYIFTDSAGHHFYK